MLHDLLQALSIGLTLPALILCIWVLLQYKSSLRFYGLLHFDRLKPLDWIAAGIFVGFLGEFLDGAYWGMTWLAHYYDWEITGYLLHWGVVVNIPTRTIMVIMAAYGHLRASLSMQPDFNLGRLNNLSWLFLGLGFLCALGLIASTMLGGPDAQITRNC